MAEKNPLYEHFGNITNKKVPFDTSAKYSPFMITRLVSMWPEYVKIANKLNHVSCGKIPHQNHYDYYLYKLPQRFVRINYMGAKDKHKGDKETIEMFCEYFECTEKDAIYRIENMPKKEIKKITNLFSSEVTR